MYCSKFVSAKSLTAIVLQQPLLHVKLTTKRSGSKAPALLPYSTMTATSQVNRHKSASPFLSSLFDVPCCLGLPSLRCTRSGRGTKWNGIFLLFSPVFSAAFSKRDMDNGSPLRRWWMYPPTPLTCQLEPGPRTSVLGLGQPNRRKKQRPVQAQEKAVPGSSQCRQ